MAEYKAEPDPAIADSELPRIKHYSPCMEKQDRIPWVAGQSCVSFGVRVGVRVNREEALDTVLGCLPPGWRPSAFPVVDMLFSLKVGGQGARAGLRNYHLAYAGVGRVARTMDLEEAMQALESSLHLYVAEHARRRVFIHAGVVGWRDRAIILPGRTFTGKSTLTAALLRAGAVYYSDEYAVIDEQGLIHPFGRPLGMREGEEGRQTRYPPEHFGGRRGRRPLPIGLIVSTEYREGARWSSRRMSPAQALNKLFANTVPARSRPEYCLEVLGRAVRGAAAVRSRRGEAEEAAELLLRCW